MTARAFACLLLLAASAPPPALQAPPVSQSTSVTQVTGTIGLAPDAENRWVPFELTPGNQIRFAMTLDGRPVTAILDTGVSDSVLSSRFAGIDKARLRPGEAATAIGGSVATGRLPVDTVALGGLTRRGGTLLVADLPAAIIGGDAPVDLLVGRDLTEAAALDIDYPNRRFRLIPSGRLPFPGVTAPLTVTSRLRVYQGEVTLNGRRLHPVVVDTGDGSSVTVTAAEWAAARPTGQRVTTSIGYGLGGVVETGLAILPQISVGRLTARNVEVRIEPAKGFSEGIGAAGRVGSGFLGRYRVLLDPRAGHMVFQPGPDADKPPLRSTSGLLLALMQDRLRVLHVMRGSPAALSGWSAGDTICAVDGRTIGPGYATDPSATWTAGKPGRTVQLTGCQPGARPRALTLRSFY